MGNKKINVHNKGLLVLVIISVAIVTLLAGISNYIPRSTIGRPRYLDENNFIFTNFLLNIVFYSLITFGLVSATSLTIKKRNNANTRN